MFFHDVLLIDALEAARNNVFWFCSWFVKEGAKPTRTRSNGVQNQFLLFCLFEHTDGLWCELTHGEGQYHKFSQLSTLFLAS